ncbi:MAG: hypothetical protein IK085_03170 [Clostridia bacterium]|nr:hypothetical protein [Clostridia bacterium]
MSDIPENSGIENETAETEIKDNSSKIKRKNTPAPVDEKPEDNICIVCGKNRKAKGEDYCASCLNTMRHRRPPVFAFIAAFLVLVISFVAGILLYLNYAPSKRIIEARAAVNGNRMQDAYNAYEDAFNLADELNTGLNFDAVAVGRSIRKEEAKPIANLFVPYYAYTFLANYFSEDEIKSDPQTLPYYEANSDYKTAYSDFSQYTTALAEGTMKADEALEKIRELKEKYKDDKGKLFWVLYAESYVDVSFNQVGPEKQLEYLENMEKTCPGEDWYYLSCYRSLYYQLGMHKECVDACNKELAYNHNEAEAYFTKLKVAFLNSNEQAANDILNEYLSYNAETDEYKVMKIMINRRFGNIETAVEECENATKLGSGLPELYRQKALNALYQGDYTEAFENSYNAYSMAYNLYNNGDAEALNAELLETVFVCTSMYKAHGDGMAEHHSDMDSLLSTFKGYEKAASENSKALLAGEKTAEQILSEGAGDLV